MGIYTKLFWKYFLLRPNFFNLLVKKHS